MSVTVLRAHFGMIGPKPTKKPRPQKFCKALASGLQTRSPVEFQQLSPLLIINFWDTPTLLSATPKGNYGRLRLLADVAMFLTDFDSQWMPSVWRTKRNLEELRAAVCEFDMVGDIFTDQTVPADCEPGFFKLQNPNHKWKLRDFWDCWLRTLDENWGMLSLFNLAHQQRNWIPDFLGGDPLEQELESIMSLPMGDRTPKLKSFLKDLLEPPSKVNHGGGA